jgi:hypothetical protein
MAEKQSKMGFNATWSMAVGGMLGGGIFSVLALAGRPFILKKMNGNRG